MMLRTVRLYSLNIPITRNSLGGGYKEKSGSKMTPGKLWNENGEDRVEETPSGLGINW